MIASIGKIPRSCYVHIPFCSHKCHFCDFAAFAGLEAREPEYFQVLAREISTRLTDFQRETEGEIVLETLFVGGGTPGLSRIEELKLMKSTLEKFCTFSPDCEISLETTPHAITEEKATAWLKMGINRLSIGIESFHDAELKAMGRDHSRLQALKGIEAAARAGHTNISLDFMYGLPEQTLDSFRETLRQAVNLAEHFPIQHISAYGLEIAVNAPLLLRYPRDSKAYVDEDGFVAMFETLVETLEEAGFKQYEVSNFARQGFESRHNITYWENEPYFAFGVGAHRYVNGVRSANSKSFNVYMRDFDEGATREIIDQRGEEMETLMLALRMRRGLDLDDFQKRFRKDLLSLKAAEIANLREEGLLQLSDTRLQITRKGLTVMNSIIGKLLTG